MRKRLWLYLLVLGVLVVIFVLQQRTSSHVVLTQGRNNTAAVAQAGSAALYPNPTLTPGGVLTTDAGVVCTQGYAGSVRNVSTEEKKLVYAEYGVAYPEPKGSFEVDHFISLELGGSNDISNLWPEPAEPKPGFHEKDAVENYLHAQVCSGQMVLTEAQKEISTDWYAVYLKMAH